MFSRRGDIREGAQAGVAVAALDLGDGGAGDLGECGEAVLRDVERRAGEDEVPRDVGGQFIWLSQFPGERRQPRSRGWAIRSLLLSDGRGGARPTSAARRPAGARAGRTALLASVPTVGIDMLKRGWHGYDFFPGKHHRTNPSKKTQSLGYKNTGPINTVELA